MMVLTRRLESAIAVLTLWTAGLATAQENLDKGKTPAQLYASDCAICHKSPRGLAKGARRYRLDNFLRAHYTASREAAAAISAYLRAIDRKLATGRASSGKRKAKASTPKLPPRKPAEGESFDTKSPETKPSESKSSESKAKATTSEHEEANTSAPKASGPKPVEHEPAASQPAEAKAEPPKVEPSKPAQGSKDAKGPKPDKSD